MNAAVRQHAANLTPRQREMAALVAEGYTNQQIAQKLVMAPSSVTVGMTRLYDRLGLPYDRNQRVLLALWWVEHERD